MKTKTEESVLNGGVLSVEFAREIGIGDHGIVRREMVALVIEMANPDLSGEDNASVRVENKGTSFAAKRSIGERGGVKVRADWRNGGSEWDYTLDRFNLCLWPHVPTHPNSFDSLWLCVCHFPTCFLFFSFFSFFFFNSFLLTMKFF